MTAVTFSQQPAVQGYSAGNAIVAYGTADLTAYSHLPGDTARLPMEPRTGAVPGEIQLFRLSPETRTGNA